MPKLFDTACMVVESLVPIYDPKRKKPGKKRYEQLGKTGTLLGKLSVSLFFDVLSRVPADKLLQLRCVSKAWNDVVVEPDFAKLHLKVSGSRFDNYNLIVSAEKLHLIDYQQNEAVQLKNPLTCPKKQIQISGVCNGLVCIYDGDLEFAVWNPLTGQYRRIPVIKFVSDIIPPIYVNGFGYDSCSNEYKVVRFGMPCGSGSMVEVYTLRSKHWRKIGFVPHAPSMHFTGVLASGALHWIAEHKMDSNISLDAVVAFDIGSETCRKVPLPHNVGVSRSLVLVRLGTSLCIPCYDSEHCVYDIWVLNDYQMQSWCKLFSIAQQKPIDVSKWIKPLTYSNDGREVILQVDFKEFVWYNLQLKTVRHANISGLPENFRTEIFVGSLVDPNSLVDSSEIGKSKVDRASDLGIQENRCKRGINVAAKQEAQRRKDTNRDGLDGFLTKGFKLKL